MFSKNVVYVFGVPGAGKTTLLSDFILKYEEEVEYINFGDIFFNIAKSEYNINNRDEMAFKLKMNEYKEVFEKAVEQLELTVLESDKKLVIIDTHLVIKTNFGLFIGTPSRLINKINPDGIVVVKAKAEEILERRALDKSRKRELENKDKLEELIRNIVSLSFSIAYHSSSIIQIINNNQGRLEESKEKMVKFLTQFL